MANSLESNSKPNVKLSFELSPKLSPKLNPKLNPKLSPKPGAKSCVKRNLGLYCALVIVTIVAGLLSRASFVQLPEFLALYAGDTLWAMMVFWLLCCLKPRLSTLTVAMLAIGISYSVEVSQLYHAPWIESIRSTRLGGLALGFGFKWSDIVCYSVGVMLAALIDLTIVRFNDRSLLAKRELS